MKKQKTKSDTENFEKLIQKSLTKDFFFKLYVAGVSRKSSKAVTNIKNFCEKYLKGHYELEILDIYQQTKKSIDDQVIVAPTLIKKLPLPLKKLLGDMSDTNKILIALDIKPLKERGRKEKVIKQGN